MMWHKDKTAGPGRALGFAMACLGAAAAVSGARAADYYDGKTLTVMIASKPGGGTDTTGRLVARFWGTHIPGKPSVIVRNKPLQVLAGNDLHFNTRPDGLTVGVFAGGGSLGPVARKSKSARYDPTEWGIVGSIDRGPSIQIIRKSALARMNDPKAEPIAMGSVSTDRTQDAIAVFGAEYLGWNLKFVLGYPNSNAIYLAYGRGEIDMFGSGTTEILNRFLKQEGAVAVVAQSPRPDFPGIKTFDQLLGAKKPKGDGWRAFQAWTGPSAVDKYFALSPATPKNLTEVLRASFKATTASKDFDKEANNILGGGYAVLSSVETADLIASAVRVSAGALKEIDRLRAKYGLPKVVREASPLVRVKLSEVKREGRRVIFTSEGEKMELSVSGSRSEVMVGGKPASRSALKAGMSCDASWAKNGSRTEARKLHCN